MFDERLSAIRRLIDEVMMGGDWEVLSEIGTAEFAVGARRWIAPFRESFPDVRTEIVETVDGGDTVVVLSHVEATAKETDKSVKLPFVHIWRFNSDGQATEVQALTDTAMAADALGKI